MNELKDYQMRVYVANRGKYSEGVDQGGWITLPVTHGELDSFLKETVGLNDRYQEYAIHDREDGEGLLSTVSISEFSPLDDLNLMCRVFEDREQDAPDVYERVKALHDRVSSGHTPLEWANVAMNSDDLPYYAYNAPSNANTKEERYAWTLVEEGVAPASVQALKDENYLYCFDMNRFGRDIASETGVTLADTGYFDDMGWKSDLYDKYSREELTDETAWLEDYDEARHAACDPADPLALDDQTTTAVTR